jgi:hypothetical protein
VVDQAAEAVTGLAALVVLVGGFGLGDRGVAGWGDGVCRGGAGLAGPLLGRQRRRHRFYGLAQELGELPRNASAQAKLDFWVKEIQELYRYYSRRSQRSPI